MSEETAIRIAEALEGIESNMIAFVCLFAAFGIAFWIIAMFKN